MDTLPPDILRAHKGISFVGISISYICYDKDGKFVMAKRSANARDEHGTWDIGAGGLKWGDTAEATVRREVLEEYGAEAQQITFLGYRDVFRTLPDGTKTHWLCLTFAVLVRHDDVTNNEPDMFDNIGWFTLGTLPTPLHSQQLPTFERFKDELQKYIR